MLGCSSSFETTGQVFVDSSSGPIKIAQADIYVLSEETIINNLKSSVPKIKTEYVRLSTVHKSNYDSFKKNAAIAGQVVGLATVTGYSMMLPSTWPNNNAYLADSTNKLIEQATTSLKIAKKEFEKSEAALIGLADGSNSDFYLPKVLKGAAVVATSDADGRFTLSFDAEKRVAIVAKKDDLVWFVWINPKKGDQIFLTNKNLNGTKCDNCVFNMHQLNSSLSFISNAIAAVKSK